MKKMEMIKDMIKLFNTKNTLLFLGFSITISFIWIRFIRDRLPKNIPFDLSLGSLLLLVLTCILYLFVIYKIIYSSDVNNILLKRLQILIKQIFIPLTVLHNFILENSYTQKIIFHMLSIFTVIVKTYYMHYNESLFFILFFIMPKVLLLICFLLDCFFYNKLHLIYSCVFIVTLPLFLQYLLSCIPSIREKQISLITPHFLIEITSKDIIYEELDYDAEGFLYPDMERYLISPSMLDYGDEFTGESSAKCYPYLSLRKFINYQVDELFFNCKLYSYKILFFDERKDVMVFFPNKKKSSITIIQCENILSFIINITLLEKRINFVKKYHSKTINRINIIIHFLFLVCWVYILFKSIHTLPMGTFNWLKYLMPHYENPFM